MAVQVFCLFGLGFFFPLLLHVSATKKQSDSLITVTTIDHILNLQKDCMLSSLLLVVT